MTSRLVHIIILTLLALAAMADTAAVAQQPGLVPRRPTGPGDERVNGAVRAVYGATTAEQLRNAVPSTAQALECRRLDAAALRDLRRLPNLRELTISGTAFTADHNLASAIDENDRLERVVIADCTGIDRAAVTALCAHQSLQLLRLNRLTDLVDESLRPLRDNASIGRLDLRGCSQLGNDAASHIAQMQALWSLDIGGTRIGDDGVRTLAGLAASLRELLVDGNRAVTDAGMDHLVRFDRLDSVSIAGCAQLTDAAVTGIARRDSIRLLRLARCPRLTDAAVERVASSLPNIEYLDVSDCPLLGDRAMRAVARLWRKIAYLDVSGCSRITDVALRSLADCALLEWLRLDRLGIDGSGLAGLTNLPRLRELSLNGCKSLAADQLSGFSCANLELIELADCPLVAGLSLQDLQRHLPRLLKVSR
ncbi:MAG: hypothetical protein AB7K09_24830 [Planctomycetota bacterium]